jgi:thiazole synthase
MKKLIIDNKEYSSRLLVGTGKYKDFAEMKLAIEASGAEIVTVAVRRVDINSKEKGNIQDYLSPKKYTYLPNTAGCYSAKDAVRTLKLARDLGGWNLVKLEVIGDEKTLLPNVVETIEATKELVKAGFKVMAYTSDDLIIAKILESEGAIAIMPLGAPIGSGLGIQNPLNIRLIVEEIKVPVLVDAGVGTASDAVIAMELGCDAILINTAIAKAKDPIKMAESMRLAVISGRLAFESGRMETSYYANPSTTNKGKIK